MKYRRALVIALCISFAVQILGKPGSIDERNVGKSMTQKAIVGSLKNNAKQTASSNAEASKLSKASSGSLFSAWGIISLILFVIGSSALIYYISIFYPMVCAKRGKYDVMEMTAV